MPSTACWSVFIPPKPSYFSPKLTTPLRPKRLRSPQCTATAPDPSPGEKQPPVSNSASTEAANYFESLRKITETESALSNPQGLRKSYEIIRFLEDGTEPLDRYVYVEERDCIGCTHCATTATGTFFIEPDHGRARVFDQQGDMDAVIEEAIDTCPVNCIYYVDWDDLVKLENMRDGQRINNWARLVGGKDASESRVGVQKTKVMDSGIMRCENCPKRGCSTCPLYGVGKNPEYLRKKKELEARKKTTKQTRERRRL